MCRGGISIILLMLATLCVPATLLSHRFLVATDPPGTMAAMMGRAGDTTPLVTTDPPGTMVAIMGLVHA